jgi:hypothetical protein
LDFDFSGAEMRRAKGAVQAIDSLSGANASRLVSGQSQLSFRVSVDEPKLEATAVDESEAESTDPDGATSWWATVMEPIQSAD